MARTQAPFSPVKFDTFQLAGGLDLVTPPQALRPGVARDSLNFEVSITGGYSRIAGYERFDGRTAPGDAALFAFQLSTPFLSPTGTVITTAGGATATVVAIDGVNVYYTAVTGVFSVGNTVLVSGGPVGTVVSIGSRASGLAAATYQAAAADYYRAQITAVPGSGAIRGVAWFNSTVYAWRDNAGGTALGMYKSTPTGWQAITFGRELAFTAGTSRILDGVTVTGATSAATGVVARTVLESGVWTGTAVGRLILSSVTGTFTAGEILKVGAVNMATASGPAAQITYAPGGRVQVFVDNFGGSQTSKLYGADGTNRGFEFDGTTFVPIRTGMAVDAPVNVCVHKSSLFFSFGPSVQFSALGLPYQWSAVLGAGEIVTDGPITAFAIRPGNQTTGALGVYTAEVTSILYGTSIADFQLSHYNTGLGAATASPLRLEDADYSWADRGVTSMTASQIYGNFDSNTLTQAVRPFIQAHRGRVTTAAVNREKSQYRIFYSDGYGLYTTISGGKTLGSMPVYFPNPVLCWAEVPATTNAPETSFFGSSNGYVYRLDAGGSCDGANMDFSLRLNFNAVGNARLIKRYRKAALEVNGTGYATFAVGYSLSYSDATIHDSPIQANYVTALSQPFWDSFIWDNFYWDGQSLAPVEIEMSGSSENVAMQIFGSSTLIAPFTINTTTIHYTPRRTLR